MNEQRVCSSKGANQSGAVVILAVVLLLVMVTLVTLYTGKIQTFEHRIVLNTQNHTMAYAAANAGLEMALASVNINKDWGAPEMTGTLDNDSHYAATGIVTPLLENRLLITLSAEGQSADRLAQAHLSEQVLVYPLIFNLPLAPLTVKGGFDVKGRFELVFNPDGLGIANPLSLWSDTLVDMSGASHYTCSNDAFIEGDCLTKAHSHSMLKLTDIADDSRVFPTDLLAYIFNTDSAESIHLKEQADVVLDSCDVLDIDSLGMFWIYGDCVISESTQVGSESQPIVVLVYDGSLELENDVVFHGLLVSYKPPKSIVTLDINMLENAAINGALVANYQLGSSAGVVRVIYNQTILRRLQTLPYLKRVARVPGSWHDF